MSSRAAILIEPGQRLEFCEVGVQEPGPGEVRVEIKAAGVCHTDLTVMRGYLQTKLPAILGHEGAGIVSDVGAGVTSVQPGDHVISPMLIDLYRKDRVKLDELLTRAYPVEKINEAYDAIRSGEALRSVVTF